MVKQLSIGRSFHLSSCRLMLSYHQTGLCVGGGVSISFYE